MAGKSAKLKIACPCCRQKLDVTDLAPFDHISCPRCGGDVIAPKPFGALLLEEPLGQRHGVSSYRALDLTLDREVLVKILERDVDRLGDGFQALARTAAAVNHSGVVPVYSCGTEQGLPYLVTQFMPGGALATRLQHYSPAGEELRQAVVWIHSLAGGLQAAAAQGVVHGAVSPLSVFLDAEGHAKLADFGLEVLLAGFPTPGGAYDTDVVPYLSPELLDGSVPTAAADVFGLGAVLHHVLSGSGPCGAPLDQATARLLWQAGQQPRPPREVNPEVPQELSDVCLRMLSPDPRNRPTDLAELAHALTWPSPPRVAPGLKPAGRQPLSLRTPASRAQAAVAPVRPRRDRWMNLLISGCAVAALALGIALYLRGRGDPPGVAPEAAAPAEVPAAAPAAMPSATRRERSRVALLPDLPVSRTEAATVPGKASSDLPHAAPAPGGASAAEPSAEALGSHVAQRPRPAGLDFLGARQELVRYLRELPPELLAGERERLDLIGDTRDYLVTLMKYVPYLGGKESDIVLRSARPLRGTVPYGNESQVAIRVQGVTALRLVPWSDLAIEQVIAFLDFYIRLRAEQGQSGEGPKSEELRRDVAEDCLRAAVLCDWYERPEEARRYARQAVDTDPAGEARARRLLPAADF